MSTTYQDLNAEVNLLGPDGKLQLHKDREAARAYHLEEVNKHTRFFHNLREKTDYLLENNMWSRETVETFTFDQFKALFKQAYAHKFRFPSYIGAFKFYQAYALRDFDRVTILERYEDRVVMVAIDLSGGDYQQAKDIIDAIITGRFQPATPTFLNAGRAKGGERVSCFLLRVEDTTESITRTFMSAAQLSRIGGGVGINFSNIREKGATVQGIKGAARGLIPPAKVLEDTFSYFDQLGQRQGAGAIYVHANHPDVMEVLDSKKENADEKIRLKTLSIGIIIPDIAFELARDNDDMYLFSPHDVEKVEGKPFTDCVVSERYWDWVDDGRITKKKVKAREFFATLSEVQFESGYPYVMFEDNANRQHPLNHVGRVSQSNLCVSGDTEILTSKGYRKVLDLYESQEDFKVISDKRGMTLDLNAQTTVVNDSTRMVKTAENADVFKVTTTEGFQLKATEWHKFHVVRDGEVQTIPLAELVEGDKLLVQGATSKTFGDVHNPDLAYVAGVLAADGTFGKGPRGIYSTRLDLYDDKVQFKDKITEKVHNILRGREDIRGRCDTTLEPQFREVEGRKWALNSTPLTRALEEQGVTKETKVTVPEFVKLGDYDTKVAFIDGVWAMDGCVTGNKKAGNISLELGSVHPEFLRDMQKLLLELGIYTRIYMTRKGGMNLLPDGNGGLKEYPNKDAYSLRAMDRFSREELHGIVEWREVSESKWDELNANIKSDKYYNSHKYTATVESVTFDSVQDVYDVCVGNGHSVIFAGIATSQCSEIMQVQTPSEFNPDGSFKTEGSQVSCNLGSFNMGNMLDLTNEEFIDTVIVATKALDQVSRTTSIDAVPDVRKGNENTRSIGLGQMNWHGALASRGIEYGSEESLKIMDRYMARVTWAAMLASTQIAAKHGAHAFFDGSEYQTGEWFERVAYPKCEEFGDDRTAWHDITAPSRAEWDMLRIEISKHGMANGYLQAIPPTGSISYINHSTSSIHPVASGIEIRKEGKLGRVYYPQPGLSNENAHLYQSASTIGYEKLIDTYAVAQHWVDQGLSLTVFVKDTATTRDLDRARIYAWRKGVKSVYYIRTQQPAMAGTAVEGTAAGYCESCQL